MIKFSQKLKKKKEKLNVKKNQRNHHNRKFSLLAPQRNLLKEMIAEKSISQPFLYDALKNTEEQRR